MADEPLEKRMVHGNLSGQLVIECNFQSDDLISRHLDGFLSSTIRLAFSDVVVFGHRC